jgi:hypothetical protein
MRTLSRQRQHPDASGDALILDNTDASHPRSRQP